MIQERSVSDTHSEERGLRRCLRDLVALTSLPLVWKDKTPREIADDLAAVLESTLCPEIVLVRITGPFAEEPLDAARAARRYQKIDAREISEHVAPFLELESEGSAIAVPNPIGPGELQIALSPLGALNEYGVVLVGGSGAHGFPTTTDRLLMNVASNQAAALLENVALRMRERELQAKAESQRLLLETVLKQLPCGVIIANPSSGDILLTNSQAMELFKQPAGQTGGRTLLDFLDMGYGADGRPNEPKQWLLARAVLNGEAVKDEEFEHVLSDGERRYLVANSAPVRNDRGEIIAGVVALQDVTELRETQQRLLLKSEEKYRDLVDLSPDAIFIVDSDSNYVSANPAGLELLKCTAEELTCMPVSDTYLPEERDAYLSRLGEMKTETTIRFERTLLRTDGTTLPVEVSTSPVRHGYFQTVVRDISERKRSEAALAKAFQEIQTLKDQLQTENIALREEIDKASMFEEVVGTSPILQAVLSRLSKVAPTDSSVLVTGETGTGKELVARAIHRHSHRSSRAFVSVNCAAIPRDLIASELFGHEKGAFTGATQRRLGRFEMAEGGTIFLDEVGELPAETQIALLRVLQEHEFERVGGTRSIRTDVRLIAATNRDLQAAIAAGTFRSDLFYRLNVFPIEIPPLRERREDIPLLVEYFIDRYARKAGKSFKAVNKKSLDLLQSYPWPGNIRELQNVIERSVIVCDTENFTIDESWLSRQPCATGPKSQVEFAQKLAAQEREMIEAALTESGGRVYGPSGAAAKLGMPRSTLESKIRSLKINKQRFESAGHSNND
ncbi:MAG: Formate hydrogenlyase transcriptional activator [Bryobacterales bacterium]|nr:Formate hydrogenlyase transcriptional activator [Bryobacterales bacterium]